MCILHTSIIQIHVYDSSLLMKIESDIVYTCLCTIMLAGYMLILIDLSLSLSLCYAEAYIKAKHVSLAYLRMPCILYYEGMEAVY